MLFVCFTGVHGHPTSYGTNFIFAFPYKDGGGIPFVLVTTQEQNSVTVTVSVPGIGFTNTTTVSSDQMATLDLPEEAAIQNKSSGKYHRTVIVDATDSVSVHGYYAYYTEYMYGYGGSGFLVKPTITLDRRYVAASFARSIRWHYNDTDYKTNHNAELAVSAIQDETTVVIGGPVSFDIVLHQYETIQYVADGPNVTDVTGLIVTADKPVSVMSGHEWASVPLLPDDSVTGDYLMDHIPPISALGSYYVIAPFMGHVGSRSGYVYRIIATASGITNITISDGQTESLLAGQFYQGDVTTNDTVITISADKPVMVSQYAKGSDTAEGDPFMIVIPSTNAYSNNVSFPVATLPRRSGQQSYISVITPCEYSNSVILDDQLLNTQNMLQTPEGDYCVLQTPITKGSHSVTHPSPDASFLVLVYGFVLYASYRI